MALFTIKSDFSYDVVRKIFEGGMGVVYEGEQHGARNFAKRVVKFRVAKAAKDAILGAK